MEQPVRIELTKNELLSNPLYSTREEKVTEKQSGRRKKSKLEGKEMKRRRKIQNEKKKFIMKVEETRWIRLE